LIDVYDRRLPPIGDDRHATIAVCDRGHHLPPSLSPRAPLGPAFPSCCAAALLLWNIFTAEPAARLRLDKFFLVGNGPLIAYIIVRMLEYVFVLDHTQGGILAVLTIMLAIFAVNIPMLLAFSSPPTNLSETVDWLLTQQDGRWPAFGDHVDPELSPGRGVEHRPTSSASDWSPVASGPLAGSIRLATSRRTRRLDHQASLRRPSSPVPNAPPRSPRPGREDQRTRRSTGRPAQLMPAAAGTRRRPWMPGERLRRHQRTPVARRCPS